jgi:hypothetical protein
MRGAGPDEDCVGTPPPGRRRLGERTTEPVIQARSDRDQFGDRHHQASIVTSPDALFAIVSVGWAWS